MYSSNSELAHVTAFRNGSLTGAYFMLALRALGLDCGPMSGFSEEKVSAEFFPRQPRLPTAEACVFL
jgi:nitroreductase